MVRPLSSLFVSTEVAANTTAAMQIVTHDHPQVFKTESSCVEQGITCREVELSCGCKMPIVAGAVSPEGHHKLKNGVPRRHHAV